MSGMPNECGMDPKRRDFNRRGERSGREDNLRQDNNRFEDKEKRRWLQR